MPCFAGSDGNFYMWLEQPNKVMASGGADRVAPKYLLMTADLLQLKKFLIPEETGSTFVLW